MPLSTLRPSSHKIEPSFEQGKVLNFRPRGREERSSNLRLYHNQLGVDLGRLVWPPIQDLKLAVGRLALDNATYRLEGKELAKQVDSRLKTHGSTKSDEEEHDAGRIHR